MIENLLKRMQYCPQSGQGLLYALGVMEACQDSRNFLMINALLKSITWLRAKHDWQF